MFQKSYRSAFHTTLAAAFCLMASVGCRPETKQTTTPVRQVDDIKIHVGPVESEPKTDPPQEEN